MDSVSPARRVPTGLIKTLYVTHGPAAAVRPEDARLVLPQGGTNAPLLLIIGIAMLLLSAWLLREHEKRI